MRIYKIPDGTLNVPARLAPHKNANIKSTLEEGDKIFSDKEKNDYIRIVEVEMPGHGIDISMKGCWVHTAWVVYRGEKENE